MGHPAPELISRNRPRRITTPFPWDPNLPANQVAIERNYVNLREAVVRDALDGVRPTVAQVRDWHRRSLRGVRLAEPDVAGGFRGEGPASSQLSTTMAMIGAHVGAAPADVTSMVAAAFQRLNADLDGLDTRRAAGEGVTEMYVDILRAAARIHGAWVRIHPFVDHNGSTARLLCLSVGLRYGVPFKLPGKPRTTLLVDGLLADYETAADNQMLGDDGLMVRVLHQLVAES